MYSKDNSHLSSLIVVNKHKIETDEKVIKKKEHDKHSCTEISMTQVI